MARNQALRQYAASIANLAPSRFEAVSGGRVFTCQASDGKFAASVDSTADFSQEGTTRREALEALAEHMRTVAAEIDALAKLTRS